MALFFVCPQCHKPVEPIGRNATMSAATKQWQHVDCRLGKERRSLDRRRMQDRRKNGRDGEFVETR